MRRRGLTAALAITMGAGLAVLGTAAPAAAAPHYERAEVHQLGYTDSADPKTAFDAGGQVNLPIGARTAEDGTVHRSRVYATFDLDRFHGKRILGGTVAIRERDVADCSKRAIELWHTKAVNKTPSWHQAPDPLSKLDEILTNEYCPANITFDVSAAVQQAVAQDKPRVTFEIRVPEQYESDVSYGRKLYWYTAVSLNVQYNTVPELRDQHMYNGGRPCVEAQPYPHLGYFGNSLQALGVDGDEYDTRHLTYDFAVWPQDDAAARTEFAGRAGPAGYVGGGTVPDGVLVDGRTYAWQYRVGDGADTTAWSRTCYFVYDRTAPSAPVITSSNYPNADSGEMTPLGEPGEFTFSGGGNTDVAGFEYSWNMLGVPGCSYGGGDVGQLECPDPLEGSQIVRADVLGGSATVLLSPQRSAYNTLRVRAIDLAGNRSAEVTYEIFAPWQGAPVVSVVGAKPQWNEQVTLRFSPGEGISGTTEYEYRVDFGEPRTVTAAADGTATIQFLAGNEYGHNVTVRSHSANGWISHEVRWDLTFYPWPEVTSDVYDVWEPRGGPGVPGTFTFTRPAGPEWVGLKGYEYSFDGGESIFVAAGADGSASITWTPPASGYYNLEVYALRADGTRGDYSGYHSFIVA
ncbi:hypothetical protein [Catellatospora sichuanensis]|uniref:hypothetical protein n=1 Tax=Catellatospora sichuanensis TaxID=1969805 RepID=UPI001181F9E5|nr:hypothetical protein [Catellatospora sichuanensis]